jgi:TolB protein
VRRCLLLALAIAYAAFAEDASISILPSPAKEGTRILGPVSIEGGHRYTFACEMKVEGEKRWRFRAPFSGFICTFFDAKERRIGEYRQHTSCWQTVDWRLAWISFDTPRSAISASIACAITTDEDLPGKFLIRNVSLEDRDAKLSLPSEQGLLTIAIRDETGSSTLARCYVRDDNGREFAPRYSFEYSLGGRAFHVTDESDAQIVLAEGEYEVTACKGFEYAPSIVRVRIVAGTETRSEISLQRRADLAEIGWWSGDHHTHLYRHGGSLYPMMQLSDVYTIARAEGLNYLPFMGLITGEKGEQSISQPAFLGRATEELTRDFWGHICPVGITGNPDLRELGPRFADEVGDIWPFNYDCTKYMLKHSAANTYAHPYGPIRAGKEYDALENPDSGLVARGYPIDLALGQTPAIDILAKEDANGEFQTKLRDYMRLLNLGFRSGVTGSTDFHLDQGREPIGGLRTYVHTRKLGWPEIAAAYMHGGTFATNGPLLVVNVNGKTPGKTVALSSAGLLDIDVASNVEIGGRLRLWKNAEVVWEKDIGPSSKERFTVPCDHSSWVLVTLEGPATPFTMYTPEGRPMVPGQFAITSPVYVEVKGKPMLPDVEAAQYFVGWVDAVERGFNTLMELSKKEGESLSTNQYEEARARFKKARAVFESKATAKTN